MCTQPQKWQRQQQRKHNLEPPTVEVSVLILNAGRCDAEARQLVSSTGYCMLAACAHANMRVVCLFYKRRQQGIARTTSNVEKKQGAHIDTAA
jgi:hypothetical protein